MKTKYVSMYITFQKNLDFVAQLDDNIIHFNAKYGDILKVQSIELQENNYIIQLALGHTATIPKEYLQELK